jgi:hypothetical protein
MTNPYDHQPPEVNRDPTKSPLGETDYRAPANRGPASWADGETGPIRDVDLNREGPISSVSVYQH